MYKKYFLLILLLSCFCFSDVFATNDVDYKLTITNDFQFIEEINYSLTDYKQVQNGDNYFSHIVNDDKYTDIFYKTKYNKTKKSNNNKYLITLKHTYNEYTFSNSLLVNNCFGDSDYKYDVDKYSFNGSGGFNCLYGDSLKITITSNFESTSNNAKVNGNSYVWVPTDSDFTMNLELNKKYEKSNANGPIGYDDINDESTEEQEESIHKEDSNENEKKHVNKYVIIGIIGILLIASFCVVIVLKRKNNSLNKI